MPTQIKMHIFNFDRQRFCMYRYLQPQSKVSAEVMATWRTSAVASYTVAADRKAGLYWRSTVNASLYVTRVAFGIFTSHRRRFGVPLYSASL